LKESHYNLRYSNLFHELSFVFNITIEHINARVPQWQVFQSLHPSRNWALVIMPVQCSVLTDNSSHSSLFQNFVVTEYRLLSRLFSTYWADRRHHHRLPSDHFLHATLSLHHHYTSLTTGGEFRKGNTHPPSKPNHMTNFFVRKSAQYRCHECHLNDWILRPSDACYPCYKRYILPNNKLLNEHKIYRIGKSPLSKVHLPNITHKP
jgi:hypothetical protein